MKMTCQKCGKKSDRASNSQKFCFSCSPHKRQISGRLQSRACATCGESFEPNSARQRFCRKCSPWFPKHQKDNANKPRNTKAIGAELTCCHCGSVYGRAHWAKKRGLKDEPCPKCEAIVWRQRDAKRRRWELRNKKELSKFGKELLLIEEEARERNKKHIGWKEEDHFWTRMRYVSEEEIDSLKTRIIDGILEGRCFGNAEEVEDSSLIMRRRGGFYQAIEGFIKSQGFYRAEKIEEKDFCFWTECAGGIPTHGTNSVREMIASRIATKRDAGIKKWSARIHEEIIRENKEERARREWAKSEASKESLGFFRAMAMAGAVKTA